MVIPPKKPDDDELSYEDFDDTAWVDDELEVIDLDALDADIPGEEDDSAPAPAAPDQAAESLLDAIDRLDDDLAPAADVEETTPELVQEEDALPVEEAPAPSEPEPVDASPTPSETPAEAIAAPDLGAAVEPAAELAPESPLEPAPEIIATAEPGTEPVAPPEPIAEPEAAVEQTAEPEAPPEPVTGPEATAEQTGEPEAPPEPVIPPEVYCALLPLPPELASQVIELRKTGEITTMPPPGIVLTAQFRTTDLPAVEAALAKWARAQLPFQFEIVGVSAKVTGAQQYTAAWTLEPEEEIVEAQHALKRALAEVILPLPGATMTFSAHVPIGEQIAAARYPLVVGQMQRDFEPFVWRTNDLQLVRQGEPPGEWKMIQSFD
jgi:hypothetical protein